MFFYAMSTKIRVFISNSHDPYFNLATEDWIFRDLNPDTNILFIWRNQPTVVIGRFQNPWTECNLAKMNQDQVFLVRRQSGGGAVFQDLGNTNFTFMSGRNLYKKENNNQILINALKENRIDASATGRNDLTVNFEDGPRKISGSAFKENRDRCFHHGTMLINVNLEKLGEYLSPSKRKLQAKGIVSVRARVANLTEINKEITHETMSKSLIQEFFNFYKAECEIENLTLSPSGVIKSQHEPLYRYYQHLKSNEWRLSETPEYTHSMEERFTFGEFNFLFFILKGVIQKCTIYSDSLHPEMVEIMMNHLENKNYSDQGINLAFDSLESEFPMYISELLEIKNWILSELQDKI